MKKILVVLLLTACAVTMNSCKEKDEKIFESPEKVTAEFVKAFYTADFDQVYKYIMKNNYKIIQSTQPSLTEEKEKEIQQNKIEIQEITCTFKDDSVAECKSLIICNGKKQEIPWILRKSNDKWLIDLTL